MPLKNMKKINRIVFLDIFAAIGILLVVLHHLTTVENREISDKLRLITPLNAGNIGVLYFLFRSGYGLYNSKKDNWLLFYKRRFLRIIPALFIATTLMVLISWLIFKKIIFTAKGTISAKVFLANAFGVQNLVMVENINGGPTWFISVIIVFYLLFPLIFYSSKKILRFFITGTILIVLMFLAQKLVENFLPLLHYYFIVFLLGFIYAKNRDESEKPRYLHLFAILFVAYLAFYYYFLVNYSFFFSQHYPQIRLLQYVNDALIVLNSYYLFSFVQFHAALEKIFAFISSYSYYIFIVHVPIIFFLAKIESVLIYVSLFAAIIAFSCFFLKISDKLVQKTI